MNRSRNNQPRSGVDDFFGVLKSYNKVIAWTFGSAVAPIAAGMVKLAPPWPSAIIQITAMFEVLALIFSFQLLQKKKVNTVNRIMIMSLFAFALSTIIYLVMTSMFVYIEPVSGDRFVKGFSCTPEAVQVFAGRCPFFSDENLRAAEWDAGRLWQSWSITVVRVSIVILWATMFSSLASSIGAFLVYQSGVRARVPG